MNNFYRKEIDFLRAIAVIFVILFHYFPKILPKGYLGVDLFFVISGFLISFQIYDQTIKKNFWIKNIINKKITEGINVNIIMGSDKIILIYFIKLNIFIF